MHVAIIPDGNRRWAHKQGLLPSEGHRKAVAGGRIKGFLDEAIRLGLDVITLWAFSTENWKRSEREIETLFGLLRDSLPDVRASCTEHGIRFRWAGRRDRIPAGLREDLERLERDTSDGEAMTFVLCFDYGGRDDILRAMNELIATGSDAVTEEELSRALDTGGLPDPDVIIRTSGERRLSGLYAWQGTYAELFFVEKHFPDFTPEDLRGIVKEYEKRERRFGGES